MTMEKRIVNISQEKFKSIDFSQFKCVKKHLLSHHDIALIALMKMPYKERKDVHSGLYYKDGFLIEVISFRGKSSVTCRELYNAQKEIYQV
jgi:hypothetical protein